MLVYLARCNGFLQLGFNKMVRVVLQQIGAKDLTVYYVNKKNMGHNLGDKYFVLASEHGF